MTAVTKLHMEYCNSWVANGQILRIKNILKICEVNLDDTLITYFKELNKDYLS